MTKVIKILGRTFGVFFEWMLIFVILFAFLIRTSSFQSYLAKQATDFISKEWNTKVNIGKVDITLFNRIYLEDVLIHDLSDKRLVSIRSLEVLIQGFGTHHLTLDEVILEKGEVWVYAEKPTGEMNFQFIADYFASEDTTSSPSEFTVALNKITLKQTKLRYDDFRIPKMKSGLDFNHVALKNVNLTVSNFVNDGPLTAFNLDDFHTKDQSGLWVKALKAKVAINETGLRLNSVYIKLNRSEIHASEIAYSYTDPAALDDFNNKVLFNIAIQPSTVNLADVAFFVPEMEGMNEQVQLSGTLYNVVNHFKIKNLDLRIRKNTFLKGDLDLPDFAEFAAYPVREVIRNASFDVAELSQVRLPDGSFLSFGPEVDRLGTVRFRNMVVDGKQGKLILRPVTIKTEKGDLSVVSPIKFDVLGNAIGIQNLRPDSIAVALNHIQLGEILGVSDVGEINGNLKFSTFDVLDKGFKLTNGSAYFSELETMGYVYHNVALQDMRMDGVVLNTSVQVDDPNAKFTISGGFDIEGKPTYNASMRFDKLNLGALGFTESKNTALTGEFTLDTKGPSFNRFEGGLTLAQFNYTEDGKEIKIPSARIDFNHSMAEESLKLRSNIADLDFKGKIDPNTIQDDILFGISRVLPSLVQARKPVRGKVNNEIDARLVVKDINELTDLFVPGLEIDPQTEVVLMFDSEQDLFGLQLTSSHIMYDSINLEGITLQQRVNASGVTANLLVNQLDARDSLIFHEVNFLTTGIGGKLNSSLGWDQGRLNESRIQWRTTMNSANDFDLLFDQSRFSINGYKWYLDSGSDLIVQNKHIQTNKLMLRSDQKNQRIEAGGCLSNNVNDVLGLSITNLDLEDLSKMLNLEVDLSGKVNGSVGLANAYEALTLTSNVDILSFFINQEEVGEIHIDATYNDALAAVGLKGTLAYRGMKTLDFSGSYLTNVADENLRLRLDFQNTDISFTNAFMDPDVLDKIEGKLNGFINIKGTPDAPRLAGTLSLKDAAADFTLLGCRYTMNGKINVEQDGFLINKLPIRDADGNVATIDGTVYHSNFTKFNYNVDVDFEEDYNHSLRDNPGRKIDKFMLLNTKYKEGDVYYGKAYGRGTANISGYGAVMNVSVNVQTRKGTKLVFPMYGTSELEEESIITFVSDKNLAPILDDKIDFTGVDLDLTFDITPDAEVLLVFNEQTHDEIQAKTQGKLNLKLDAYNQMRLDGGLKILNGSVYNFTMGPARKPFDIIDGTINWSGDVYNADMKIVTSYLVKNANMLELTPEQTDKSLAKQDAQCILNLTGSLIQPNITFELLAPKAPESGKALMNRINEDKDELNRQFFSLMLFSKFQPFKGTNSANESAAIDLVESQINQALSQMSKSYQVKMDLGTDNVSTSVQKSFAKDRLVVTGSFGVQNTTGSSAANGGLVGDVSIEYLVNESGTFRVNAFNRSNTNTVKENSGPFTQGAGLSYHEDFNSAKDFVLLQSFLDVFRSKENKVVKFKRKKRQTKLPPVAAPTVPVPSVENKEENE